MKCQKCGANIPDGKMYCEACGNEICIVPDFEPEVEQTMHQSMENILNDVFDQESAPKKKISSQQTRKRTKEKHYFLWIALVLILSFFVLVSVFGYMNYSADYQIHRGHYYLKLEDYEGAIRHYEKAGILEPDNAEIALYLASCFEALDRMPGYEACLTKVIQNTNATEMQRELAYTRLATLYLEKQEYQKIDRLLKNCEIENVIKIFSIYQAQLPVFSHEEGEYDNTIPLKIKGGEKCTIYYTVDGQEPTTESTVFESPIFLNKGEHTIKAICVNEFGVSSEVVTVKFIIKF